MVISLIHPSRSRPEKAFNTAKEWIEKAGIDVNYCCSLDAKDPFKSKYLQETNSGINIYDLKHYHKYDESVCRFFEVIVNDNKSVVEATNVAAKNMPGDIFIYLSDDFICPENWGALVLKEFEGEERPLLVKVDDCLQNFDVPVLTIPMMNRALYEKLGYFWFPEYKSMFCDTDLFETCRRIGAIKNARHLKFPHEHVSIGKAQDDETYRNSARNWDQGKALFAKRKAAGFPI